MLHTKLAGSAKPFSSFWKDKKSSPQTESNVLRCLCGMHT